MNNLRPLLRNNLVALGIFGIILVYGFMAMRFHGLRHSMILYRLVYFR